MSFNEDPDSMKECPFDPSHLVQAKKLQYHILKCQKSHSELAKSMEVCPFNATHRYLGCDKQKHLSKCIDANYAMTQLMDRKSKQVNKN